VVCWLAVETWRVVLLGFTGLLGGIGITALGPGGVLPTIGLFALAPLTPAQVAGTAIVTHVATGALGTAAYRRSGELRRPDTRRVAVVLAMTALVGTPLGIAINAVVPTRGFGVVLAVLAVLVAVLVLLRQRTGDDDGGAPPRPAVVAVLGVVVGAISGLVGIGGPMVTVPLLVALGTAPLAALAAAQVQSVVVAGVGTLGYVAAGAVDWPLAALVGIPELAGVLIGWRIARALPTRTLTRAMVVALLAVAPYLALHG
jgi:uncharacterized protein